MGVDPSTKTGVVVLGSNGELLDRKLVQFKEETGYRRLQLIAKSMESLVKEWKPTHVVVEGFAYGNKFTFALMVQTGTIVRQALYSAGISWYDVPPTQIKKFATGNGKATKADMAKAVQQKWNFTSDSDDIVDAYAMAQVARHIALSGCKSLSGVKYEEPVVS